MTKCTDVAAKTIDLFVMYKLLKIKLQGKYILVLYFYNRIIILIIKKLHHSHFVFHVKFSKNNFLFWNLLQVYCKFRVSVCLFFVTLVSLLWLLFRHLLKLL